MDVLLEQYNPHWENRSAYNHLIEREHYIEPLSELMARREILVLKGIRRCGKSSLLKLLIRELVLGGVEPRNILFMNMEDYRFGSERDVRTLDAIYLSYREQIEPRGRVYVLLDEIQEVTDFERWLRTYYDQDEQLKFVVSGSSSSLFSAELATLLTGRQVSIEVFPFSFPEYLAYKAPTLCKSLYGKGIDTLYMGKKVAEVQQYLERYLVDGGFPEVLKHEEPRSNILLLQQYFSDIILRDIAQRHNVRRIEVLQKLALYLILNMSNEINVSRLATLMGSNRTTVLDMIAFLKEVYLIFSTSSFSFAVDEQLNTTRPRRIYCVDNGFYGAVRTDSERDGAKRFRNCVYQQLRFRWDGEVFYWRGKREVEFIMEDGFPVGLCLESERLDKEITDVYHYLNTHNLNAGLLIHDGRLQILEENERKLLLLPLWLFLLESESSIRAYIADH